MNLNDFYDIAPMLLLATLAGYIFGAIPLAQRISHWHGVDIFATGTRLAGSSNVRLSVGKLSGFIVLTGDFTKGIAAVLLSEYIGIDGAWILAPIAAAVVGHCKSIFSNFRGGDGLATLGGAIIAVFPVTGAISVLAATVVSLGAQGLPYTSLLGVVFGYVTLVVLVVAFDGNSSSTVVGIGVISGIALVHALNGHRLRARYID
jgi:glycerol-3-phosphate acyltransferase PlsY